MVEEGLRLVLATPRRPALWLPALGPYQHRLFGWCLVAAMTAVQTRLRRTRPLRRGHDRPLAPQLRDR
jgi:hypothetical protein